MTFLKPIGVAIFLSLFSLPAVAVTITTDPTQPSYTGLLAAPTSSSAGFRLNFQGSDLSPPAPNSRTPWEEFASLANTAYYNSVEGGGFAEYVFDTARTTFSLMWGSPDGYNTLAFLDNMDNELFSIAGNNTAITNTPGFQAGRKFVNVTFSGLSAFTKVRFTSGSDAFEFANVAPIPLPAPILLLAAGIGGLGLVARKKRA